jgi:hypothetical protein
LSFELFSSFAEGGEVAYAICNIIYFYAVTCDGMPINLKVGKDLMSEGHYVCGQNNFSEPVRGVMNAQVASSGVTSFKSKIVEEFTSSNKCFKGHIASIVYPE